MRVPFLSGALLLAISSPVLCQAPKLSRTEVVVLVDLSDRVDPRKNPSQLARDTAILGIIEQEFSGIVKRNRFLFSRDRLRMLYLGGENLPAEPRVDVAEMNDKHRVVVRELPSEMATFHREAIRPYLQRRTRWDGADVWSWFKNSAPTTLQVSDPSRKVETRLVLITDGYLEFDSRIKRPAGTYMDLRGLRNSRNWEQLYPPLALKPVGTHLPATKVLLLELAPQNPASNTSEQEILQRFWRDWFRSMGVEVSFLTNQEPLPSVRDGIRAFLSR